eukprot:scaffold667591_cov64-Prasinocladus_malaysianus.AAC.1
MQGLGMHLQALSRAVGVEIGPVSSINLTAPLLEAWPSARSYAVIDIVQGDAEVPSAEVVKAELRVVDRRIRYMRTTGIDEALDE